MENLTWKLKSMEKNQLEIVAVKQHTSKVKISLDASNEDYTQPAEGSISEVRQINRNCPHVS